MNRVVSTAPRTRAEILMALNSGFISVADVVHLAVSEVGKEIRPITLKAVLTDMPRTDARTVLARS